MRARPDDDLLELLAETNDQRRAVGQALWALHRALVSRHGLERPFAAVVRSWAPGAAKGFEGFEARLRRLPPHAHDPTLRRWLARAWQRLGEGLARGEFGRVPTLRALEASFPELTAMMREEARGSRIRDLELARELRILFGTLARADASAAAAALLEAARALEASAAAAPRPLTSP